MFKIYTMCFHFPSGFEGQGNIYIEDKYNISYQTKNLNRLSKINIFISGKRGFICYYTKLLPVKWFFYSVNQKIISNRIFFPFSDYYLIRIRGKTRDFLP